jgi:hypothetical protein
MGPEARLAGPSARAFASEGASLFLTGRHLAPVNVAAKDVVSANGFAEAAEVDVLGRAGSGQPSAIRDR